MSSENIRGNIKTTGTQVVLNTGGNTTSLVAGAPSGNITITLPATTGTLRSSTSKLSDFAATTSAELAGVISDETGSGALVFATSPTLVTPTLGVASATSINKVALTAPATGSTLTIADGKTLTASATITLTGTDGSALSLAGNLTTSGAFATTLTTTNITSLTLPTTGTLATLAGNETLSGKKLSAPVLATGGLSLDVEAAGAVTLFATAGANNITIGTGGGTASTVVIPGNLEVQGTTITLNTANLDVEDVNITLNNGGTNAQASGAGLTIENGWDATTNAVLAWNTTTKVFEAGESGGTLKKLLQSGDVVNADISGSAAIAYSKLNLTGTLLSADIAAAEKTGSGDVVLQTSPTITTPTLSAPVIDQANFTQAASATTPAAGKSAVYVNSGDSKLHVVDSSGNDVAVGSGSSGRNYLGDWFDSAKAESVGTSAATSTGNRTVAGNTDPTKWVTSDLTNLTFARSADTTLRQSYNYLINSGDANADFVESPLFTLDGVDLGKPITVSFDCAGVSASDDYQVCAVRYDSSGTYLEVITIAGTASATTPYSARIPTGTTKFQGFFIAGSTASDQYAIRFMKHAVNVDLRIDSLYVGPEKVVQGLGGHDWKTPTTEVVLKYGTTTATNITSYNTKYRRVGDSMDIKTYIIFSGAANANGDIGIVLPDGLTIDPSKVDFADRGFQVNATLYNSGKYYTGVSYLDATSNKIGIRQAIGGTTGITPTIWAGNTTAGSNVPSGAALASGNYIEVVITGIPISNWSSNVTMADRAVEEQCATSSTWDADDTGLASLVRGYAGGAITGALTTARTKRVRFNTPVQVSDNIEIKFARGSGQVYTLSAQFIDASGNRIVNSESSLQTISTSSGVYWRPVSGSNTDIDVIFARYAALANDDSPAQDWVNGWYWIANKVSGGAVVGYPIGARNIVGDTTGTAVPKSVVGEVITGTNPGGSMTSGVEINASALTLTPGTWRLDGQFYYNAAASTTISRAHTSIASASATIEYTSIVVSGTAAAGTDTCHQITKYVTVTVDTPYYLVGLCFFAVSTMDIYTAGTWFRATRIA